MVADLMFVCSESRRSRARYASATVSACSFDSSTSDPTWRGDSTRLMDTPLIDFIGEVQRKAANADLASTAAFTLDASIPAGPITVARIAQLYPYDNTLRAVRISGQQLKDYLEFSSRFYKSVSNGRPEADPEIPGYNFDIITGITALIVAAVLKRREVRGLALAWNVIGLALLLNIVVIDIASTPTFAYFGPDRLNTFVAYPPFVWLPAVMVLAALAGHLLIFRALRSGADRRPR